MKKSKHIVGGASIAVLLAAGIVGNSLCSIYYSQIQAYMQRFVTSSESANSMTDLSRDDAYTQALQLCEEVESEGLVLLKNDNDTLPLGTDKINLFGYNSYKTVYTDYGSGGHHNEDQNFNFIDGFEFAGLQLNPDLTKFYQTTAQKRASMTGMTVSNADFNIYEETLAEYDEYSATFWQDAKAYSDVAVYVIGRMAGEGNDCPLDMAGYYGGTCSCSRQKKNCWQSWKQRLIRSSLSLTQAILWTLALLRTTRWMLQFGQAALAPLVRLL